MIAEIKDNNTIYVYDLTQFDPDAIMHSGQIFRYFECGQGAGRYSLISGSNYAEIIKNGGKIIINCNDARYFFNYFDLQTDYNKIKEELKEFKQLKGAIGQGGGIRILRADFYETVLSFIISANNNIKRFTKTLNLMSEKYGTKLKNGLFGFPVPAQLSGVSEEDYKNLGCGYRSAYLVKAVRQLKDLDFNKLNLLPDDLLLKELTKIMGVGKKVAACIMLFAFHRLDVAPVDTWIQKALDNLADNDKKLLLEHKYAGVIQQYIYYYLQYLHKEF